MIFNCQIFMQFIDINKIILLWNTCRFTYNLIKMRIGVFIIKKHFSGYRNYNAFKCQQISIIVLI